jgi:hypothetical protein
MFVGSWQSLRVFNSLGQEIETFVGEYLESGFHSNLYLVNFTLRYRSLFYRLQVGIIDQSKKLVLLK